jgi:hypothetical protein
MRFRLGALAYVNIVGERRICIIESMERGYRPDVVLHHEGTEHDYYWVIPIPVAGEPVQRKWVKGDKMEVISEGG